MSAEVKRRGGSKSRSVYRALVYVYGEKCLKCGSTSNLHVDHVIPRSVGGADSFENFQLLCARCNLSKQAKTADYRPKVVVLQHGGAKSADAWVAALVAATESSRLYAEKYVAILAEHSHCFSSQGRIDRLNAEVERLQRIVSANQKERASTEASRGKWSWWPFKLRGAFV